ncbi:hypothetical protein PGIGA_G00044020 [Pangasianodon gigas]|uniref:Uncharacterized protein n=1 Tax=Pangasianodon gigas TaxID=30993 RepID=A0ACC5X0V9_PANGG|nr:hypothetical protein [Pangasianodon gigas]
MRSEKDSSRLTQLVGGVVYLVATVHFLVTAGGFGSFVMKRVLGSWAESVHITLTLVTLPFTIRASGVCKSINTRVSSVCTLSSVSMSSAPHIKARCTVYPGSDKQRFPVPDDKVSWATLWPEYSPVNYTAPSVLNKPAWADPDIGSFSPRFNSLDGSVDRRSHEGDYSIQDGRPLNPRGRTGLNGQGLLGRWGPNHAADPIVTRWKQDSAGKRVSHAVSKRPVLQFVSIKRKDCGEWAIPGGMVDPGELVSQTLQREFSEEALNSFQACPEERKKIYERISKLFSSPGELVSQTLQREFSEEALNSFQACPEERKKIYERISKLFSSPGFQVYKGYVDDPRNTDNSWMETVAVNFHDELENVSGASRAAIRHRSRPSSVMDQRDGMVDPGELVSQTLQREFSEEALNSFQACPEERKKIYERISKLFSSPGFQVYKGYVDDPRNTDNSWMETVAVNFHDELGDSVSELPLQAGDDAGQVSWCDVDSSQPLYASHSHFLQIVAEERHAHW